MKTIAVALGIAVLSAATAFAQGQPNQHNPGSSTQGTGQQSKNSGSIRQQVQDNLSRAGFTDIKIMPESFLVRAKDRSGNPVMMLINPDSVTAITEIDSNGSEHSTTGSASQPNAGSSGSSQPGSGTQPGSGAK